MKITFLAAVSALALATTVANAADVSAPAPAMDWTGFYAGIGGGGNFVFNDLKFDDTVLKGDGSVKERNDFGGNFGSQGGFGTIELGYDYQIDKGVIGIIGNFDFGGDIGNSEKHTSKSGKKVWENDWSVSNTWAIGARAGYLASESTLLFIDGGYTQADLQSSASFSKEGERAYKINNDGWAGGYFLGAGVQTMLTENLYLKAEYRFSSYGSLDGKGSCDSVVNNACKSGNRVGSLSGDVDVQSVRGTLGWRF